MEHVVFLLGPDFSCATLEKYVSKGCTGQSPFATPALMSVRSLSFWEVAAGIQGPPRTAQEIPRRADVVIVGAGFCGSWLAYFLKTRHPKLQIAILERDFLNLGASVRNAGFLSCGNISEWLEDLQALGWEETLKTFSARLNGIHLIQSELGVAAGDFERCGSMDFDPITDAKLKLLDRFNGWRVDRGEEPFFGVQEVVLGGKRVPAIENRFDGSIDPCRLLGALHGKLRERQVHIYNGVNVEDIAGGEATVSHLSRRQTMHYGYAFVCTNGFNRRLIPSSQVVPARGQILVTSPCRTSTHRCLGFIRSGYDYFRFIGQRVLIGGGRMQFRKTENTDRLEPTEELKRYLIDFAGTVIGNRDFTIDYHWAGIMGLRDGRHASISEMETPAPIDSQTEEVSSCGGWGVTLSPCVAHRRASIWGH